MFTINQLKCDTYPDDSYSASRGSGRTSMQESYDALIRLAKKEDEIIMLIQREQ